MLPPLLRIFAAMACSIKRALTEAADHGRIAGVQAALQALGVDLVALRG